MAAHSVLFDTIENCLFSRTMNICDHLHIFLFSSLTLSALLTYFFRIFAASVSLFLVGLANKKYTLNVLGRIYKFVK